MAQNDTHYKVTKLDTAPLLKMATRHGIDYTAAAVVPKQADGNICQKNKVNERVTETETISLCCHFPQLQTMSGTICHLYDPK